MLNAEVDEASDILAPFQNAPLGEVPPAMKKPLFLLVAICTAILTLIAHAQPQSVPEMLGGKSAETSDGAGNGSAAETHFDGNIWWNYVKVLAADDMEGRETGSPGLRKAQEYVAGAGGLQGLLRANTVCVAPDRGEGFQPGPGAQRAVRAAHAGR
jgi:hypothetical protein